MSSDPGLGHVLIVEDDEDVLIAARLLIKQHAATVTTLTGPDDILATMRARRFDVILMDMNFTGGRISGREGLDWLDRILAQDPAAVVVLMTAYGDAQVAAGAIKRGATDFVLKPWQNEKLLATLGAAAKLRQSRSEVHRLRQRQVALSQPSTLDLIAESKAMHRVLRLVEKAAPTDANVLILGENGTGKEVIARELWRASHRSDEVFLAVDLGALPESLFESELFGHVKGAFTDARKDRMGRFQAAEGGTLLLDEIGNLPGHLQAKLLRALEQREVIPVGRDRPIEVDVRLICATNRDLEEDAQNGSFRPDLLYRINTVQIEVPPLRTRPEDIEPLARHFILRYARKYQLAERPLTSSALDQLKRYHWPGNVRELEHAIERALILAEGDELHAEDFALRVKGSAGKGMSLTFDSLDLEDVERSVVAFVMSKHDGNISHTARELGITRTSLYRRLKKHDL